MEGSVCLQCSCLQLEKQESSQASTTPAWLPTGPAYSGAESQVIPQASASMLGKQWGLKAPQAEPTVLWSFSVSNSATEYHPAMLGMRSITRVPARLSLLLSAPGVQTLSSQYSLRSVISPFLSMKQVLQLSYSESSLLWITAEQTKDMKRWWRAGR